MNEISALQSSHNFTYQRIFLPKKTELLLIIVQWNFQICCSKCTCYLTLPLKPKYHNLYFIIYDIGYILHLNIFSFARKKFFANPNHKKWAPHKLILYILFPIELQLHEWIIILFQQLCMMMMNQFFKKKKFLKLSLKILLCNYSGS